MKDESVSAFHSFEEFLEKVKKAKSDRAFGADDLNYKDLKSGAVLNFLNNQPHLKITDLINVLPLLWNEDNDYRVPNWQQQFWSNLAGDLDDVETTFLIENYLPIEKISDADACLVLTFALKNDTAWDYYKEKLLDLDINNTDLLNSLSKIHHIDKKFLPLLEQVFDKDFTKVYLENKELIDRTPRKWRFTELMSETLYRRRNFLDAYTRELKELTVAFGQDPTDYECLSNALTKEGFMESAEKLAERMLKDKEKYATLDYNNNSNSFIRKNFSDIVEKIDTAIAFNLDRAKLEEISDICFKEARIARQIREGVHCKDIDLRFIRDVINALPDNMEQVDKAQELFMRLNERPETYGSDYNRYYPCDLIPLIKVGVEDWMYPVIVHAMNSGVISRTRLGTKAHLFDAAKTWQINSNVWKKEAEMIGKMPLEARMVAGAIFNKITDSEGSDIKRSELRDAFWAEMKKAQDMGWKKAIIHYCDDNATTCGRFLSIYHPEYAEETRKILATSVHLKDLVDLDMDRLLFNADLWQTYLGIDKREMLALTDIDFEYPSSGQYDEKLQHKLIRRLAMFEKLFPDEDFRQKYLDYMAKKDAYSSQRSNEEDAVMWFPHYLSDEKTASFAKFLEENLFYDNRYGFEAMRPKEQLERIAKVWSKLSVEEEQFSYEKLLGLSYMQQTIETVENNFDKWTRHCRYVGEVDDENMEKVSVKELLNIPDDLDIYQKALLYRERPKTRKEVEELLAMSRQSALNKISSNDMGKINYDSKILVDLIVGDDWQINDLERQTIAEGMLGKDLADFEPKTYKEILDHLIFANSSNRVLFRKYYTDMSSYEPDLPDNASTEYFTYNIMRERTIPLAVKCAQCLGKHYQQYFDKIEQYNSSVDEKHRVSLEDAVKWLPTDLRKEDQESFNAFMDKYMFYNDGNETFAIRPFDQLEKIGAIWHDLTPEQREFNYEKLLGLCYTQKTVSGIDCDFDNWKRKRVRVSVNEEEYNAPAAGWDEDERPRRLLRKNYGQLLNIPDDLRLYQKLLLTLSEPNTQEKFDECLSYRRKDGMIKIAEIAKTTNNRLLKRKLVDLTIGNDAQINDYERDQIAGMNVDTIMNFSSKHYKEIVDKIMGLLDPKAYELFRKYYADMTAETVNTDNQDVRTVHGHYQESRVWIAQSAVRCMQCYGGDYPRFFNNIAEHNISIKKAIHQGIPNVSEADLINVHDALYWLPENLNKKDRQSFKEFVDRYLFYKDENNISRHRDFSEFESVAKAWSSLSEEERKMDYDDIVNTIQAREYPDCKYLKFGRVAKDCLVPDSEYKRLEKIYEQGLQVPELIDSSKRFYLKTKKENEIVVELVGYVVPRWYPRALFFGKYTHCCQHYDGAGKACAISSVRDPFSALFVVEKANGDIVAGSWVWESKIEKDGKYYKALCFDNIEAIGDYKMDARVTEVYKMTLPYLASLNYAKVTVGMGNQDGLVDEFPDTELVPMNRSYSGYSDAGSKQKLLLDNPNATPVDYNEGDIYVTGAMMEDIPAMRRISERCFPEGDRALQLPDDDPQGLLLRDKGEIVGYVVYSEKERSIYDMAVLPEYRSKKMKMPDGSIKKIEYKGGSRSSSLILLEAMAKKIRQIGGKEPWTAELRDITSFKYMQFMAARGLVDMKVGGIDHEMSDTTKVIKVTFSIPDKPKKKQRQADITPNSHDGR